MKYSAKYNNQTDPNGNRNHVAFDALRRVTALAVMGKAPTDPDYPGYEEGDSLAVPWTTFSYDLHAFEQNGEPASVTVIKRETHIHSPNANNETLNEVGYTDGLGNELQRRVQFDASNGVAVTGRQIVNNKGLVVQYEPYLDTGYAYSENSPTDAAKVRMSYDPLNRLIRTDFDDGTFTKVEFNAWQQKEYDQNDTVLDSQWYVDRGSPDPNGPEPTDPEERAAWLAAKAYNTPRVLELDPLGRMFLRRNDNGSDGAPVYYDTRFALDILGRKRKVTDARGLETVFKPSLLPLTKEVEDRTVNENGPDSGKKWVLSDVAGKPAFQWDGRSYRQRMGYDIAQRPTGKWVTSPGSSNEILKEKIIYGETVSNPRTKNLRGQVYVQHDQAGKQGFAKYDFKGNLKEEERQFATVYDAVLDYSGGVPLNTETYQTEYSYDALDRPTEKSTPDNSASKYGYAKNALLQSEAIAVRGSGIDSPAITDIKYDAKGQRTDIYYANGSKTKYEYDPATFRITRILTTRNTGADILQDLNYVYDAAGNIVQMRDDAQQTIYFANQVVEPLCKYTYDSLYRLKKASGRELNGLAMPTATDCPIQTPVPDTDANACRNYTQNYQYDELGNILKVQHIAQNGNWTRDYFYPTTNNRLIGHTSGQTDYTYDEAGNMLSMPHLSSLTWNEDNMPVEVDLGGGGTAYYRYDGGGNRIRKVVVNGNLKKQRLYIGDFEVWQQSSGGTVQTERETLNVSDDKTRFLQLDTLTVANGTHNSNPTTNWRYQYDNHLGSACLELDGNAAVISYEEYFPFGSTSYRSGKNQAEVKLKRYRYCGKERDEETGLYYYGARYYASWLGRFISCDLLKNDYPQLTPYNYAGNKSITYKDLHGLQSDGGDNKVEQVKKPFNEMKIDNTRVAKSEINPNNVNWNVQQKPIYYGGTLKTVVITSKGLEANANSTLDNEFGQQVTNYSLEALQASSEGGLVEAFIAKGEISTEAQRGWGNFTISGSVGEAKAYFYPNMIGNDYMPGIDTGASASVSSGELDIRLGTKSTNVGGNIRGTLLSADANLAAGLLAGNGKRGLLVDANAGAYVAEGDLTGRVSLFGIEGNWTIGASFASAHAGVTGGFYIDTNTSHIVITGFEHFGFGIGGKGGFELRIPIWGNEIFK